MTRMILFLLSLGASATASAQTSSSPGAPPKAACTAPEHRQFDFWVGSWIVSQTGSEGLVAHSLIEKLYGGCVIRENWMPFKGTEGGSLNNYVLEGGEWRQTWLDASNARVEFSGGMVGDAMVLTGFWKDVNGPGQSGLIRMTYSKAGDGSVRQLGEFSADQGKSWSPSFDFTYRPR